MANETIQLIIQAKDLATEAIKKLEKSLKGLPEATDKVNKSVSGLQSTFANLKQHWLGVSAAAVAAGLAMKKAFDFAELGARAQQAEASFKQVTAAYGENADKLLTKMKEVSLGIIDDSNMMQRAVKGLQQGLSGDQIVKILEISRTAARVAGTDVEAAFDGMTNAIANQQLRALKQYGIMIDLNDVFERYAEKIGIAKDQLTEYDQTQAIFNAVVEEGSRQGEAFSNMQMDASEKIQKASAALKNLKEDIGKALLSTVEVLTAGFYKLLEVIFKVSGGYYKVAAAISTFLGHTEEASAANKMAAGYFKEASEAAEKASNLWAKATGELDDAAAKEKENAEAIAKARRDAANDATHAASIEKQANEEKAKSYVEAGKKINAAIKSSEDRIRSLTKTIEDSDKKIAQVSKDIDKDISDIESKGEDLAKTNPFELWQQARQKMSEAGSKVLEDDLDAAESLFQDARSMFKDLGANSEYAKDAAYGLQTIKEELIALEEQRKAASQAALDAEIQNIQTIIVKAEELKQSLSDIPLKVDSSELDAVIQKYKDLDGSEIRIRVIQEQVGGGEAAGMARGGFFPGYGGGDRIPVLAEAGEFFHKKEAVRHYGTAFMNALNRLSISKETIESLILGKFPTMPFLNLPLKMQSGGEVPSLGHYTLDLNIGADRVSLRGDEINIKKLVKILRREQKTG